MRKKFATWLGVKPSSLKETVMTWLGRYHIPWEK